MTLTVIQGFKDEGDIVLSNTSTTWADLTTWTGYAAWNDAPQTVIVQIDDDNLTSDYYVPTVEILAEGSISVELKTSDTGLFAGEETTSTFVEDANVAVPRARYWRWTITVAADSTTDLPVFSDALISYNTDIVVETQEDVDIYAAGTNSAGDSLVDTNLSVVKNVQATALQGGLYVEDGYFIPLQNATSGYVTTPLSVTNTGVVLNTSVPRPGDSVGSVLDFGGSGDNLRVENNSNYINNTNDCTIEFWVRYKAFPVADDADYLMAIADFDYAGPGDTQSASPLSMLLNIGANDFFTAGIELNYPDYTPPSNQLSVSTLGGIGNPFTLNTWHHVAFTFDVSAYEIALYIDGTLIGTDITADSTDTVDTDNQSDLVIGAYVTAADVITGSSNVYMDDIRISNVIRYTSNFTPPQSLTRDLNTTFFMNGESLGETTLFDGGDQPYIIKQRGGGPVVENKNPLALRIVDYDGNAWDGSVDLVLRGYPYITLTDGSIGPVET